MIAATDASFGIVLLVLVFIGGVVMTAMVFVRNRQVERPPAPKPEPPDLPDHPG